MKLYAICIFLSIKTSNEGLSPKFALPLQSWYKKDSYLITPYKHEKSLDGGAKLPSQLPTRGQNLYPIKESWQYLSSFSEGGTVPHVVSGELKQRIDMQTPETDTLISLPTAADELDISVRTLYRIISRREIPRPVKVGRLKKLFRSDLTAYKNTLKAQRKN